MRKTVTRLFVKSAPHSGQMIATRVPTEGFSILYITNYPCTQEEAKVHWEKTNNK